MSAIGAKLTPHMSAFAGKADIDRDKRDRTLNLVLGKSQRLDSAARLVLRADDVQSQL